MTELKKLMRWVNMIGYESLSEFIEDNPGAVEAIGEWLLSVGMIEEEDF